MSLDDSMVTRTAPEAWATSLPEAVRSTSPEVLAEAAPDAALTEDLGLALLKQSDLPTHVLDRLSRK
jgi:hypothetical protein